MVITPIVSGILLTGCATGVWVYTVDKIIDLHKKLNNEDNNITTVNNFIDSDTSSSSDLRLLNNLNKKVEELMSFQGKFATDTKEQLESIKDKCDHLITKQTLQHKEMMEKINVINNNTNDIYTKINSVENETNKIKDIYNLVEQLSHK